MEWFSFGIDPLLVFLDLNLSGIPISSLPVLGPATENELFPLPCLEERFKVMAYCDDVKSAICSIEEQWCIFWPKILIYSPHPLFPERLLFPERSEIFRQNCAIYEKFGLKKEKLRYLGGK